MKLKNTFVQGKLNKDMDERLLPKGQYPHAENVRVANTDSSDMGAVENVKGNEQLTNLNLVNAKTIGAFSDDSGELIYWFISSDTKDLVLEYEFKSQILNILLESSKPDSLLNFSTTNLITGIVKIINGDSERDLLIWTDDINAPRSINIERVKNNHIVNGADSFVEDDISLIKKPPRKAPAVNLINTSTDIEDNLKDKFLSFAYRYKYLDGEYSALSSFTNYAFTPKSFNLDYQTMDNDGMINKFNSVNIRFNTGSKRVTDIEIVSKESNSNKLSIIERFNKEELGWVDNSESYTFDFSNKKSYATLSEDELFRTYDNIPLQAKALELINNRIVFGNYVEGYDMVDIFDNPVSIDLSLSFTHTPIDNEIVVSTETIDSTDDAINIFIGNTNLYEDTILGIDLNMDELGTTNSFNQYFEYKIGKDFIPVIEGSYDYIQDDPTFSVTFLKSFLIRLKEVYELPPNSKFSDDEIGTSATDFELLNSVNSIIKIKVPTLEYKIYTDDTFTTVVSTAIVNWKFNSSSKSSLIGIPDKSIKTERSYEIGKVYMDEFNRTTPVFTSLNNTLFLEQQYATSKNKIIVEIGNDKNPPKWADRFKFVVKQTKGNYHTVYSNFMYADDDYIWVLLEGDNKNKIKEGDEIIIKSDGGRIYEEVVKTKVLSVESKSSNFIEGNFEETGEYEIKEREGLYFKIKAGSIPLSLLDNTSYFNEVSGLSRNDNRLAKCWLDLFTSFDTDDNPVDVEITAGSLINIKLNSSFNYDAGWSSHKFEKEYTVLKDYPSFEEWFNDNVTSMFTEDGDNYFPKVSVIRNLPERYFQGYLLVPAVNDNKLYLEVEGFESAGSGGRNGYINAEVNVVKSGGTVVFETVPDDSDVNIFYETEQTFDIIDNKHMGNVQNQTDLLPAIIELDFYNCYVFGNGVESYKYKDGFNTKYLNIDLRPTTTSIEGYKEVRRYADLTYSETFNENNNLNGLNEFNLSKANFKEDIDKKYGYIQKLYSRDTDLLVFQEDKVSKVLYGKDLLMNADGTSNVTSIENVLGQQITFTGEYGISRNPESFDFNGYGIYFTDAKRGSVMRLTNNGLDEISKNGMRTFFRDNFKGNINSTKIGAFDPYQDQYILSKPDDITFTLSYDEKVKGWTSFHSFVPDYMLGMNNDFFTFKDGNLYIHHSDNSVRNTYYGVKYPSKLSLIFNDSPSDVKEIQAISLEGNHSWETLIRAYVSNVDDFTQSTIKEVEFVKKEGIWYAYARRNEDITQEDSKSMYGIGSVLEIDGFIIRVNGDSDLIIIGDDLIKGQDMTVVGKITNYFYDHSVNQTVLTLDSITSLSVGDFLAGRKDARIEGGNLRGYSLRLDLETDKSEKVELFAVNAEVMKSYT